MNIKQTIRRILREEIEKKDLSPILEKLLNSLLVKHNQDIVCGVKVIHPSQRQSLNNDMFDRKFAVFFVVEFLEVFGKDVGIADVFALVKFFLELSVVYFA